MRRRLAFPIAVAVTICLCGDTAQGRGQDPDSPPTTTPVALHVVDVEGLALILDMGEKEIVIDGGNGRDDLLDYLLATRIIDGPIELVIISHAHADHYVGLTKVLETYSVEEVWDTGFDSEAGRYRPAPGEDSIPDGHASRTSAGSHPHSGRGQRSTAPVPDRVAPGGNVHGAQCGLQGRRGAARPSERHVDRGEDRSRRSLLPVSWRRHRQEQRSIKRRRPGLCRGPAGESSRNIRTRCEPTSSSPLTTAVTGGRHRRLRRSRLSTHRHLRRDEALRNPAPSDRRAVRQTVASDIRDLAGPKPHPQHRGRGDRHQHTPWTDPGAGDGDTPSSRTVRDLAAATLAGSTRGRPSGWPGRRAHLLCGERRADPTAAACADS